MAHKDVVAAVKARLDTLWSATPVFHPNTVSQPPADGSAFVQVQYPVANTTRWSVGTEHYREEGAFRLVVSTPSSEGLEPALEIVDGLASLFRYQTFSRVECKTPSSAFTNNETDDGSYFVTSFAVPYTFDFYD